MPPPKRCPADLPRDGAPSRDVAHELRTPLMGLSTAAELLPQDDEAAELVRDRASALNGLVEDLLEISRLDAGAERSRTDVVPLGELVADVVRRTGTQTLVTTRDAQVVETDPRRVERIVVNLVTNAHRHGAVPVEVTVTGTRIVVRDHGPGFPATLLDEGPQRFRTGTSARGRGHGLGLTIALGQADVLGARLAFADTPDAGATATLDLAPTQPDWSGSGTRSTSVRTARSPSTSSGRWASAPTAGSCRQKQGSPDRLPATYRHTHAITSFHGCYSVGDDRPVATVPVRGSWSRLPVSVHVGSERFAADNSSLP